jgi:triosephosphate isomerase
MNGSLAQIHEYTNQLKPRDEVDAVIVPPAVYLQALASSLPSSVACGVQDIGISASGAHTGELASEMVYELGGSWAIVGHSERRIDQGEIDDLVATKASAALRGGLLPIVCVGETLAEREAGHEVAVVERQLEAVCDRVDLLQLSRGAIAYEPVWAIGTGQTATPAQAQEMHAFIRDKVSHLDVDCGAQIRILYGGSVKPENADELFSEDDIDGGLVGGASLDAVQFSAIIAAAADLAARGG